MNGKPENRVEKIIAGLLRGGRLKLRGGDAEEKEAIMAAARLAGAHQGPQRMHPAFRKRLAQQLDNTAREGWVTRRSALVAGLGLAAGAASGVLLGRGGGPETPKVAEVIEPADPRWIDVGVLDDFLEGQGRRVTAGGVGAYVFRTGADVSAVSSCPLLAFFAQQGARPSDRPGPRRGERHGMNMPAHRAKQLALDRCLQLLEEAQIRGQGRIDGPLGTSLRRQLEHAGVIADHRLEGRRVDRVLDDIFALQAQLLGQDPEDSRHHNGA